MLGAKDILKKIALVSFAIPIPTPINLVIKHIKWQRGM